VKMILFPFLRHEAMNQRETAPKPAVRTVRADGGCRIRSCATRVFGARRRPVPNLLAAALLSSALLVPVTSASGAETIQTVGNISYVSGGVGTESQDRLNSLTKEFNLKLVFAMKSGGYVSGARVTLADAGGKTLLDTSSEGPWLLVKLPSGRYRVMATLSGKTIERKTAVNAANLKTLDFRWSSE
jgi:hypothetical protein